MTQRAQTVEGQRKADKEDYSMGVVRIDDDLEKEIEQILKRPENKYKFPSKTTFLNVLIHEHILDMSKRKGKRGRKR